MDIVFRDNGVELVVGDVVILKDPKDDDMFYNSTIGKKFEAGICDELFIEVMQKEWLEVYFYMTAWKDGKRVASAVFYDDPEDWGDELWDEVGNYHFLRYALSRGASKV